MLTMRLPNVVPKYQVIARVGGGLSMSKTLGYIIVIMPATGVDIIVHVQCACGESTGFGVLIKFTPTQMNTWIFVMQS